MNASFRLGVARPILCATVLAFLAGGCGGGGAAAATCSGGAGMPTFVQLIYPEPNATSVPTSGVILYGAGAPLAITLQAGTTTIATTAVALPSPLPSPAATLPPGGGFAMQAVAYGPLPSATTITVNRTESEPPCYVSQTYSIGSFTTQ